MFRVALVKLLTHGSNGQLNVFSCFQKTCQVGFLPTRKSFTCFVLFFFNVFIRLCIYIMLVEAHQATVQRFAATIHLVRNSSFSLAKKFYSEKGYNLCHLIKFLLYSTSLYLVLLCFLGIAKYVTCI